MTGSPARPAPRTELAGVETADRQGHREGQRQPADRGTARPGGAAGYFQEWKYQTLLGNGLTLKVQSTLDLDSTYVYIRTSLDSYKLYWYGNKDQISAQLSTRGRSISHN